VTTGKILAVIILVTATLGGAALYYLQVYAFYERVAPAGPGDVQMVARASGTPEPVTHDDFRAIDADSSPIRYRACFTTGLSLDALAEKYAPYPGRAVPLNAPGWFGCFDAGEIGAALEAGTARAFIGEKDIEYGVDRVVAVLPDGRGFAWHQLNRCGEQVFDGNAVPADCPTPPEGY